MYGNYDDIKYDIKEDIRDYIKYDIIDDIKDNIQEDIKDTTSTTTLKGGLTFRWMTTSDWRWPKMEETFYGKQPLIEDNIQWNIMRSATPVQVPYLFIVQKTLPYNTRLEVFVVWDMMRAENNWNK